MGQIPKHFMGHADKGCIGAFGINHKVKNMSVSYSHLEIKPDPQATTHVR